jgi:SET domain-containing protein
MINTIQSVNDLYLKEINQKIGWGVFAGNDIKKGDIVENCYSIIVNDKWETYKKYIFYLNNGTDALIPLGFGCIYNHSETPNLEWKQIDDRIIQFYAITDIISGDELRHNYGPNYDYSKNLI